MAEDYVFIKKDGSVPSEADFCFIMDNELMEPVIKKGERVFVSRRQSPGELEVGLFYYKGRVYCRQLCEDYAGNTHLLCANPGCEVENLCLDKRERKTLICLGRVLLKKKPPMPIYI